MRKRYPWLTAAVVLVVAVSLLVVACGGSSTMTTAGPATTAGGTATTAAGASTTAGGLSDAATLYSQNCAGCHKNVPSASADQVTSILQNGKGGMPAFKGKLTADQIAALAIWVSNGGK